MGTTKFREYPIFKKRDGQNWEQISYIFSDSFVNAKKEFAKNMTKDNFNKSNDIVWLDKNFDGVKETGFYDMAASYVVYDENDKIDLTQSNLELFCSEESIKKGFSYWSEDVYSWELRKK